MQIGKLKIMQVVATIVAIAASFVVCDQNAQASQYADWLAVEKIATLRDFDRSEHAFKQFDESATAVIATSRDVRSMMNGSDTEFSASVSDLETTNEISASSWVASLPQAKTKTPHEFTKHMVTECQLNFANGNYECASWSTQNSQAAKAQVTILAPAAQLEEPAQKQLSDEAITSMLGVKPEVKSTKTAAAQQKMRTLKFFKGAAGLVTTEGGKITLRDPSEAVAIQMSPEVKAKHISMFVRDPSLLSYDQKANRLTALNTGNTELFVVSQDRISIIPVAISVAAVSLAATTPNNSAKAKKSSATDLEMPSSLASVDVLDRAAGVHATYAGLSQADANSPSINSTKAEDLHVPSEITSLATQGDDAVAFVRAKAKATFGRMMIRVVDERSQWDGSRMYPVGGVRVRLVGTEFESRTDGQGYLEISDMPAGARVFAEIIDKNGSTMPGFAEVVFDPAATTKERAQVVMVRRYLSLDYAARMAGVVQNMENASLCSTVLDSSSHRKPMGGVRLTVNRAATGPFYFNELGYLDTSLAATGSNGRFCFFNIAPGAVALGIHKTDKTVEAAVLMTARGLHSEEFVGLEDARHLTTTVASVATAGDQLSSDMDRANKYLSVEQAEVAVVGGKEPMVPIDEGVYTSGNPVLPVRGRVWTVAASSDFETSLQASSIKLPGSRQITSLLPRGFVDDMANYAQQYQDPDLSTVVVEHAAITGQGTESVKIRLVDTTGHDVGDGWYFADSPTAKAVFFNVPAGVFSVVVETASGHWLAADTLMTDPETATYVRTGAPLEKHLTNQSAAN